MENMLQIGSRIKKQRLLMGYTRERLAELINVTPRFCYDLELGFEGHVFGHAVPAERRPEGEHGLSAVWRAEWFRCRPSAVSDSQLSG